MSTATARTSFAPESPREYFSAVSCRKGVSTAGWAMLAVKSTNDKASATKMDVSGMIYLMLV
jgi:hypothetical protein